MSCLGTHFALALTEEVAARLSSLPPDSNAEILEFIENLGNEYEALRAAGWLYSTEHAWDAIHRCLTDGKLELGDTPRHMCILGKSERHFVRREDGQLEYIVNLLDPSEVRQVAEAIRGVDRAEMRRGYDGIDPDSFYALNRSDHDFEYTWDNFQRLRALFERAADARRWVVFRVDQ